jgi:hypothetical protein
MTFLAYFDKDSEPLILELGLSCTLGRFALPVYFRYSFRMSFITTVDHLALKIKTILCVKTNHVNISV